MLKFEKEELKKWSVNYNNLEINKSLTLELNTSSITNKFEKIIDFVNLLSDFFKDEFDIWLFNLLEKYQTVDNKYEIIDNEIENIKNYVKWYFDENHYDFTRFVDRSKAKKQSILFDEEEIKEIILLSSYLKIYSLFFNTNNKLIDYLHKRIYRKFAFEAENLKIPGKILSLIKTKTFKYNITDRYMWDYISTIKCKNIETHAIEIFNFIMSDMIVLCDTNKNPITFFIGITDESIKWILRGVYKNIVVYEDTISTEDVQTQSSNNLNSYTYNDTLGKLKGIAVGKIYNYLENKSNILFFEDEPSDVKNDLFTNFQNRLDQILFISPVSENLTFPLLSLLTTIPYSHFKTMSPQFAAILSVYTYNLLENVCGQEYNNLFNLLNYYPGKSTSINTTYKLRRIPELLDRHDENKDFIGFKQSRYVQWKILSHFVGKCSRLDFNHTITGQKLTGFSIQKIESDCINFYTSFFSNKFNNKLKEMKRLLDSDF